MFGVFVWGIGGYWGGVDDVLCSMCGLLWCRCVGVNGVWWCCGVVMWEMMEWCVEKRNGCVMCVCLVDWCGWWWGLGGVVVCDVWLEGLVSSVVWMD